MVGNTLSKVATTSPHFYIKPASLCLPACLLLFLIDGALDHVLFSIRINSLDQTRVGLIFFFCHGDVMCVCVCICLSSAGWRLNWTRICFVSFFFGIHWFMNVFQSWHLGKFDKFLGENWRAQYYKHIVAGLRQIFVWLSISFQFDGRKIQLGNTNWIFDRHVMDTVCELDPTKFWFRTSGQA